MFSLRYQDVLNDKLLSVLALVTSFPVHLYTFCLGVKLNFIAFE